MYLLATFILQNLKKILRADPELWGCAIFRVQNGPFVLNKFFWYKPLLLLSSNYWPFSLCKILKNSCRSRVMRMCRFWVQNGPFAPNNIFFWKITNMILIYLLAPFTVQNFKKILPAEPKLWGYANFESKIAQFPKWEFFQKTCWWALFLSFMPIYMPKIKVRY